MWNDGDWFGLVVEDMFEAELWEYVELVWFSQSIAVVDHQFRRMSATNILKFSPLPTPCEIRGTAAANRSVKQDKGTAG